MCPVALHVSQSSEPLSKQDLPFMKGGVAALSALIDSSSWSPYITLFGYAFQALTLARAWASQLALFVGAHVVTAAALEALVSLTSE